MSPRETVCRGDKLSFSMNKSRNDLLSSCSLRLVNKLMKEERRGWVNKRRTKETEVSKGGQMERKGREEVEEEKKKLYNFPGRM